MSEILDYLKLHISPNQKTAIMGVGSELRCDDGAGMLLIDMLRESCNDPSVLLIAASSAPENFCGVIRRFAPDVLFVVDAAYMGMPVGALAPVAIDNIGGVSFSTHMLPLSFLLSYLAAETGCEVLPIGIQPQSTQQGIGICDEVISGVKTLLSGFCATLAYSGISIIQEGK
ncbi:MAG: hydrogenase 3 maturation endopeptidase HyCI [Clostridia bacterium]